jgi:hypothetical protein
MAFVLDPYALTTVGNAKQHLGIMPADTTQDDILTRMINAASQKIEHYCDRKFKKRQYTEFYDGRGNDRMLLRNWPCDKPTELWDDPGNEFTSSTNLIDPADFVVEQSSDGGIGIVLVNGLRFSRGNQNVKVVYDAGYSAVPYDIEDACLFAVEFLYTMKQDRRIGVSSKGKNGESTQFREDLPRFVLDILDRYKREEFALAFAPVGNER